MDAGAINTVSAAVVLNATLVLVLDVVTKIAGTGVAVSLTVINCGRTDSERPFIGSALRTRLVYGDGSGYRVAAAVDQGIGIGGKLNLIRVGILGAGRPIYRAVAGNCNPPHSGEAARDRVAAIHADTHDGMKSLGLMRALATYGQK